MSDKSYKKGDIVTVDFDKGSSNTFLVESDSDTTVLVQHPLFLNCLMRLDKVLLDRSAPNIKDSTERSLDFANKNSNYLDYHTVAELEALSLYFVVRRQLTPRQKSNISTICGHIAAINLDNDVAKAVNLIKDNEAILDDFNMMWYRNFSGLFSGKQPITSKKQRASIFNIAGFVLAELETPTATNGYN